MLKYEAPIQVDSINDCFFYHTIDLPGHGEVAGHWDLRNCVDEYLGHYEFSGKKALDVGAASGFLSFEMEKRGADVVSFDIGDGADWNIVPHYQLRNELNEIKRKSGVSIRQLKKSYWLSHSSLKSRAKAFYGDIYDIPESIGQFDVVLYGMILTHLRDPFQALYSGARHSKDAVIVTGVFSKTETPQGIFRPAAHKTEVYDIKGWWYLSVGAVKSMLGVLGFTKVEVFDFNATCVSPGIEGEKPCTTIIARRE